MSACSTFPGSRNNSEATGRALYGRVTGVLRGPLSLNNRNPENETHDSAGRSSHSIPPGYTAAAPPRPGGCPPRSRRRGGLRARSLSANPDATGPDRRLPGSPGAAPGVHAAHRPRNTDPVHPSRWPARSGGCAVRGAGHRRAAPPGRRVPVRAPPSRRATGQRGISGRAASSGPYRDRYELRSSRCP